MKKVEADLCIAGGGMAGVCAALAAARNGSRVVLLQDRPVLGGNASSEVRLHISGASCSGKRPGARESGIIEEIRLEDAVRNPQRSPSMFDLLLYEKVIREPGIELLLETACVGCDVEAAGVGKRIRRVHAVRNATEDKFIIEAPLFADCTGDGRLGFEAGADFRMGREARSEFHESLAPEIADEYTLGSTILLMARKHDRPMPFAAPSWARRFSEEDLRLRSHRELEYGYWWVEWGGQLSTIKDGDRIRHELLRVALGVWDHVKNRCPRTGADPARHYDKWLDSDDMPAPEAPDNWALEWIGAIPGKRESRRFLGPRVLTQNDVQAGRTWPDQVAYGGWWIDLHPPLGVDAVQEYPCSQVETPHLYSIPLGCLHSRNVENLFFAGRNISATHLALASTRVMGTCAVVGQAVGTAAAVAARHSIAAAGDLQAGELLFEIQQRLLRDDAFLLDLSNQDPDDLARRAVIRASSELPGHEAALVTSGITRAAGSCLHPELETCSHLWVSADLPAWIEFRWPRPQRIREIHFTFDTSFSRELTLTMSDAFNARMIRGPQPETVRDYSVQNAPGCGRSDGWRIIETGSCQRKRVHPLAAPLVTEGVRVTVTGANGATAARIFEVRLYG